MIEVLVVMVVVALAAGVIIPRMDRSVTERTVREAAERFGHLARTVGELAVSRHERMSIELDLDRGGYAVKMPSSRDRSGDTQTVQMSWLKSARWPKGVGVTEFRTPDGATATNGVQTIWFHPDGTGSGAALRLTAGDVEYLVVVRQYRRSVLVARRDDGEPLPEQYDLGD